MTANEKNDTRAKILKEAKELFAKHGFNGTSVRDIAKACDVNVASINYHFGNKETLYYSIITEAYQVCESDIHEISKKVDNMEQMILKTFDYLMKHSDSVRTTMRMMMNEKLPQPMDACSAGTQKKCGPPGADAFKGVLKRQLKASISEEKLNFAVKSLFAGMMHMVIISCSSRIKELRKEDKNLELPHIRSHLAEHVKAILFYIENY